MAARIARIVPGIMLLLALGEWPYSYYQALRVVVCAAAVYLAWFFFDSNQSGWGWIFAVVAVLFNPIAPIYLAKGTWQLLDVAAAVLFFSSYSVEKKHDRKHT